MNTEENEILIEASHIGMTYTMETEKVDNLKEFMIRLLKRDIHMQRFHAVSDLSFTVRRGERLGIVGYNGSGKSTTLKMVAGVLAPTEGTLSVRGKISPLIELGAGFDNRLTARENIYLNGAILGYSRKQMDEVYDSIIDFSELGEFQDVRLSAFSTGMVARLGFAIATCRVPDILIVDEILAVGDYKFQEKCLIRMEEMTKNKVAMLLVSHRADDIKKMCDQVLWLDHGKLVKKGPADVIMEEYQPK